MIKSCENNWKRCQQNENALQVAQWHILKAHLFKRGGNYVQYLTTLHEHKVYCMTDEYSLRKRSYNLYFRPHTFHSFFYLSGYLMRPAKRSRTETTTMPSTSLMPSITPSTSSTRPSTLHRPSCPIPILPFPTQFTHPYFTSQPTHPPFLSPAHPSIAPCTPARPPCEFTSPKPTSMRPPYPPPHFTSSYFYIISRSSTNTLTRRTHTIYVTIPPYTTDIIPLYCINIHHPLSPTPPRPSMMDKSTQTEPSSEG